MQSNHLVIEIAAKHLPPKVLISTGPVVRPQVERGKVNAIHHVVGQKVLSGVQRPLVLPILQEGACSAQHASAGHHMGLSPRWVTPLKECVCYPLWSGCFQDCL